MTDEQIETACIVVGSMVFLYTVLKALANVIIDSAPFGWQGTHNREPICFHRGKPGKGDIETE